MHSFSEAYSTHLVDRRLRRSASTLRRVLTREGGAARIILVLQPWLDVASFLRSARRCRRAPLGCGLPGACSHRRLTCAGSRPRFVLRRSRVAVGSLAGRVSRDSASPRRTAAGRGGSGRRLTPAAPGAPVTAAANRHALAGTRCRVTRGGSGSSVVQEPDTATGGIMHTATARLRELTIRYRAKTDGDGHPTLVPRVLSRPADCAAVLTVCSAMNRVRSSAFCASRPSID